MADVAVNSTNFPDGVFRQYVLDNIDVDGNKKLSNAEIASITEIILDGSGVANLKGIEYFKNSLTSLHLSNCPSLSAFSLSGFTSLTFLDLSYCTSWGTTLDMSGFNLPSLDIYIYGSSITKYVQNGGCLFNGSTNGFDAIKTVELSNLTLKTRDDYFWNTEDGYEQYGEGTVLDLGLFSGMETLKVTGMTVDKLNCSNKEHLMSADLRGLTVNNYVYMPYNPSLTTVQWGDVSNIAYIYMNGDTSLASFDCTNFTALQYLDLGSCTSLATISGLTHTALKTLDLEYCTGLGTTLDMSGMNFPGLALYLYDSSITKYVQNGGCLPGGSTNGFDAIKTVELSNLTLETRDDYFWNTENGYSDYREGTILDLGLFSGMETLKVTGMTVDKLNCSSKEHLKSADLRGLKVTNYVYMPYNYSLTTVQWGDASDIAYLDMGSNSSLTSFDTSAFTAMQALYFNDCMLENLDVSNLAHLKELNIYNNRIPSLNLESNTEMTYQYGLWEQYPEFKLVLLSANQVGIAIDEGFQVNKITTLQVNEANATPSVTTVDGQLYFVVNNNASTANGLVDKSIYYEYETGYVNGGEVLKVTGTAKSVEKCRSFLTLSKDKIWPTYGGTATAPTVTRSEGYDGALTYTSSNTSVVTVNNTTGKLTVKGAGTATITITGAETAYRQAPEPVTYTVTVKKASPVFTFAEPEIAIFVDEAMPQNALNKGVYDGTVTYASSNTAVATVNASTGAVTIKGAGTTTITASGAATSNCNAPTSASYTLTVSKHTATITLSKTTVNATYGGSAAAPTVTVTDGYDGTLNYTSNKTGVVTVNKTTGKLTIKGAGTATITVSGTETNTWNKPANKTYTVKVAKASPVFSFEQPFVEINNVYNMAAAENALSTGIYDGQVVFSSSDESVATVDPATGDVSFHHSGTVTITATGAATSNCNAATASYQVEVSVEATGVNAIKANMEDGYWYTPAGIRVNNPRKGQIYIHNGKKVIYRPEAE